MRDQLEAGNHNLPLALWADFLLAHFPHGGPNDEDGYAEPPPPKYRCDYLPGDDGLKASVLCQRAHRGKGLWHPDDLVDGLSMESMRKAILMGLDSRNLRSGVGQVELGRPAQPMWHVRLPDGREIVGLAADSEVEAIRAAVRRFGLIARLPLGSTVRRLS